jgi:hypothetical protein
MAAFGQEKPMRLSRAIPLAALGAQIACAHPRSTTSAAISSAPATVLSPAGDTLAALRQRAVTALLQRIAGRERVPAESVFQNVRVLRGVPAGRFVEIMNDGFGHGLGVSCGFCHVPGQWASDERPNKNVARDMVNMVNRLNSDLKGMRNLPDPSPMVGCITCHRMAPKPVLQEH